MASVLSAEEYVRQAEVECARVPGLSAQPGPLERVGIVGAGLMGGGIAMCCAEAGMHVTIVDVSEEALAKGMRTVRANYKRSVERKSKKQDQVDAILANIRTSSDYKDFADCDIVVEAVFENMKVKQDVFRKFDEVCKPGCILATNTSALSIDDIAKATKRPEDVIGCHFFSPANVMRLLENVRGTKTSPRTIATAMAFGVKIRKVTCLVGNCFGFVANRIMYQMGSYALVARGAWPHDVDAAVEAFGMKMGPFKMGDLTGIDLMGRERVRSGAAKPNEFLPDAMYAAGRFGQKNGKGYYGYDGDRKPFRDPEAEEIIQKVWKNTGVEPRSFTPDEIVACTYFPCINEGFRCLEEGIALRPLDVDVCLIYGYGWPKATGGLMRYADSVGLPKVLEALKAMGVQPAALLRECAERGWATSSPELLERLSEARSKL